GVEPFYRRQHATYFALDHRLAKYAEDARVLALVEFFAKRIGDPRVRRRDDDGNGIGRVISSGQREITPHRLVGHEQAKLVAAAVAGILKLLPDLSDDRVREAVQLHRLTDGISIGEQLRRRLTPNHHHTA